MVARPLRRKLGFAAAALLLGIGAGFPLAAWFGSSMAVNSDWQEPADGIEIMIETNGVHTGIIVPVVSEQIDWRSVFPSAALPRPDGHYPTHIAIGWGEREVFLDVPEWSDLKASTVLRVATVGGEPLMRVSHYLRPAASENHRRLRISKAQYARLVAQIRTGLPAIAPGESRAIMRGVGAGDAYYEATGHYTLATTCNTWVGEVLANSGVKMGAWTPFAGGVLKWVPPKSQAGA